MKYEMIFGDEMLFDGAPDDAIFVIRDDNGCFIYGYAIKTRFNFMSESKSFDGAMRRIIKEPKRWTWEDKKAGRLPEVGAELIHKTRGICEFIGVGLDEDAFWALKLQSGLIYIAEKSWCFPIETPAEKAARLKSEWCAKAAKQLKNLEYTSTLTSIYDALLSGELKAPEAE